MQAVPVSVGGQTTSEGSCGARMRDRSACEPATTTTDCSVLPRPMSSHNTPCNLYSYRNRSQFTPA